MSGHDTSCPCHVDFNCTSPLPCLTKNDIELLLNRELESDIELRSLFDQAAAAHQQEEFLYALVRVLSVRGSKHAIVRTKTDGTKLVTDLADGFVTLVFDIEI